MNTFSPASAVLLERLKPQAFQMSRSSSDILSGEHLSGSSLSTMPTLSTVHITQYGRFKLQHHPNGLGMQPKPITNS